MSWVRGLTLLLCFFLDVHVRAEEVVDAKHGKHQVERKNLKMVLDQGALVEERGKDFHLVKGRLLVESEDHTRISTPFVTVWCATKCTALFDRRPDHVVIKSLSGDWHLTRTGEAQTYRLPEAMQMRLAEVSDDGRAEMEFPQSLPWASTLSAWAHLFPGDPDEFKDQVSEFRPRWRQAVETASQLHEQGAARTLASHNAELAKQAATKRAEERETEDLRRQLRERNYLSP